MLLSCFSLSYSSYSLCVSLRKIKFKLLGAFLDAHGTPKIFKVQLFWCFITQLVKKQQQWSFYEVIEDILPFVWNTKRPLSDICLLRYKQNSFGCFRKYEEFQFNKKTPKTVLLITQQPNIAQRSFCIKKERRDIIYI